MDLFDKGRCYRPDEVASKLGISKRSIYRMINDVADPLPAVRPCGNALRISGADVNAYLERHRVRPEEE